MKFPSIQTLVRSIVLTAKRFPLVILFTIASCILWMRIDRASESYTEEHYLIHAAMCCYLGMLLTLAAAIFSERRGFSPGVKALLQALAVGSIVAYYFTLPQVLTSAAALRCFLFVIGLHLLIAFAPFMVKNELNGFWQYNKSLFLRILTAALYTGVLYLGLALALLALEKLFKLDISYHWYVDLWIWIAGLFNTVFFLAGYPSGFDKLEQRTDYPRGLKIFTQYVLLPLISIYILILYAYMFKIIFTREWPYGWVSWLVLIFAMAGILSLLLIHPIRNDENNKWILGFSRGFYVAICPLIVLLFLAIERRIGEYGITNERYFVLVLAIWLAFIALYFLVSRVKNIKVLPVSLCLVAFLASGGPWGAFSVSLHSQRGRLEGLLQKDHLLQGGQFFPSAKPVPSKDGEQINSIVEYLVAAHGYRSLQPLFAQDLDSMMKSEGSTDYSYLMSEKLLKFMHITSAEDAGRNHGRDFSYSNENRNAITLAGYDFLLSDFTYNSYGETAGINKTYQVGNGSGGQKPGQAADQAAANQAVLINFLSDSNTLSIQMGSGKPASVDLQALVNALDKNAYTRISEIPANEMTVDAEGEGLTVKCVFRSIEGENSDNRLKIHELTIDILVKIKR